MYCPFFILNDRGKDPSKPAAPIVRFCPKIFLAFSRDLYYTRIHMYAGVLELVDEADSKSVGLITRAGSTPATGTITEPTVDTIIDCRFVIFMRETAVIPRLFHLEMHPFIY